jgi:hypothetical protein
MTPKTRSRLRDVLILVGVLAILTLLAVGQIAATVLIMVPMVFLLFGKRPEAGDHQDRR